MLVITFLFCGLLLGAMLMLVPTVTVWVILILSLVVVGPIGYFFPELARIHWGVALISFTLLVKVGITWLQSRKGENGKAPPFFTALGLFLLSVVVATVINRNYMEALITSKNFFQFISIPLAFYILLDKEKTSDSMMKAFIVIALIQLPLAALERVLSPGFDTITGTFGGGGLLSPGPNSELAIFLTVTTGIVLALAINKSISWSSAFLLSLLFIIPIYFTNARAIVVFYLVMLVIIFRDYFFKRPLASIMVSIILASMFASILYFHYTIGWQKSSPYATHKKVRNFSSYLDMSVWTALSTRTVKMNRTNAVVFWWKENTKNYGVGKILFGHGFGASREGKLLIGHVADKREYREKKIGFTTLSRLLWDVGLVGTFFFMLIFIRAFFTAGKLVKNPRLSPSQKAFMTGAQIASIFFLISIPYKQSLIIIPAFNAFAMFILGYIAFWYKELAGTEYEMAG